jgi:hypothetical protein
MSAVPQYVDTMLEEVERALNIQLHLLLHDTLVEIEGEMTTDDASYFGFLGIAPVPATPLPDVVTWIEGHDPLVLERPLVDFPTLSVQSYNHPISGPGETDFGVDQAETILSDAAVELIANSDDRVLLERQIKRYGKAIHRVIQKDFTLGGLTVREQVSPAITVSNTVVTPKSDVDDSLTYFKGVRLEYVFKTIKSFYFTQP